MAVCQVCWGDGGEDDETLQIAIIAAIHEVSDEREFGKQLKYMISLE